MKFFINSLDNEHFTKKEKSLKIKELIKQKSMIMVTLNMIQNLTNTK